MIVKNICRGCHVSWFSVNAFNKSGPNSPETAGIWTEYSRIFDRSCGYSRFKKNLGNTPQGSFVYGSNVTKQIKVKWRLLMKAIP